MWGGKVSEGARDSQTPTPALPLLLLLLTSSSLPARPLTKVREQLDVLSVQAKQRGEPVPDEAQAKDEIENALLRKKVRRGSSGPTCIRWKAVSHHVHAAAVAATRPS